MLSVAKRARERELWGLLPEPETTSEGLWESLGQEGYYRHRLLLGFQVALNLSDTMNKKVTIQG